MKNMIWITTQIEGFHRWKEATNFLQYPHRHIFKFKIWIEISHNNREIEFIGFKREIDNFLRKIFKEGVTDNILDKSCEDISDELFSMIVREYPQREIWINVSEDGENGSFKTYERR